jgi:hypothetical protein
MPNVDDLLGPEPKGGLPTPDALLGPEKPPPHYAGGVVPLSGEGWDHYFTQAPAGRLLSAFGQGVEDGWGSQPLGLSDESVKALRDAGTFPDYEKGRVGVLRALNEAFIRPAAAGLDAAVRAGSAAFGGVQAGVAQIGKETGQEKLGRDIAAMPEAFFGSPHGLAVARDLKVIGQGEAGWKGTADERAAVDQAIKRHATPQDLAPEPEIPGEAPKAPEPVHPGEQPPTEPPPDIHEVARRIDPDTFKQYDALAQQKETFSRWIQELSVSRETTATAEIDRQIAEQQAKLEDATGKRAATYQNRIDALTEQRDAALEQARAGDSPDMTRVRQALQQADYKMRDLAPQVTEAYRQAQATMPEAPKAVEAPAAPEAAAATETPKAPEPVAEQPPAEQPPKIATAEATQAAELKPARIDIATDVSKKLTDAGRPKEEADAAAAIVAAHYDARAARLGTTAEDLYAKEGPAIEAAEKGRKGETGRTILKDGRTTIRLMGSADASTFMHETGHQWLDELDRDAKDERATPEAKKDADTVRKWLGAEDGADITRGQHEKFARGFERYLMEGRAPSQELAGVFAKFKDWLAKIYETVAKLRAPITDDIRDVFDRLIAKPAERETIAPEREAESLTDKHTSLAESTPPDKAQQIADQVLAEWTEKLGQKYPEVLDELRGGRPTGGETTGGGPDGNRDAGQPQAGPAAGGAGGGGVRAGGGEAPQESPGARSDTAVAERGRPTEPPTGPHDTIPDPESRLIDKAGNIRLDNLNTPEDVSQVIRDAADRNQGFIEARRGVLSDAQVLDLADALGMDAKELDRRKLGQAFNAEQIVAARKLLIQSAVDVRDAMVKAADGSDADLMAYAEAKTRHQMIQQQVAGITAEAGRALRAFRELEGQQEAKTVGDFLQEATGKTLFQLRREAQAGAQLPTGAQVSKFVRDSEKPGFGDMVLEYWINGLISGPATHTTYMVGNALLSLWKAGPETAAAAAIGKASALMGGEGERVMIGEVPAQLYGMMKGTREGIWAAWQAIKTGQTTLLPGEAASMSTRQLAMSPLVNPRAAIPNFTIGGVPLPVGTLARLPSRMVATIHSFYRAMNYEMAKQGGAYRIAANEGLEGDALASRIAEKTDNPTEDEMAGYRGSATDLTLMGKGGELTQALSKLTGAKFLGFQWLKFIDPFVHISSNVIEQALLQRTPVGVFAPEIRANLSGANGAAARDMAIGRMAVGTAMTVGIGSLAAEGLVNGSGPSDPKEAAVYTMVNGPPHSVRFGDTWYDVHRLGPLGMLVGISADMYETAHAIGKEDAIKVAEMASHAFTQNILDESFMRGPADLIKALSDPDRYGSTYVRNMLASFTPYSVGSSQVARAVDPYARQARTLLDAVKAKIPWLSETLLPKRDIWGEPIPNKDALGLPGLSAIYEMKVNNDPVNQALLKLGVFPALPERKIRGVQLTDQQYDDFSRIAGRMAKTQLNQIVANPGFPALPDSVQHDMVADAIKSSREAARSLVMMQNPGIIAVATKAKLDRLKQPAQ